MRSSISSHESDAVGSVNGAFQPVNGGQQAQNLETARMLPVPDWLKVEMGAQWCTIDKGGFGRERDCREF